MKPNFYFQRGETAWVDVARRVSQLVPYPYQAETEESIRSMSFVPGSPILRNAGSALNMMACHNLGVDDNVRGIWQAAADMAAIFKSGGGGVGIDLSALSARGTPLRYAKEISLEKGNTFGIATGPLSFFDLFRVTGRILGGGISGKAPGIMGTLDAGHRDIKAFIEAKNNYQRWLLFKNAVEQGSASSDMSFFVEQIQQAPEMWGIICEAMELQGWGRMNLTVMVEAGPDSVAPDVWQLMCENAARWADPGVAFVDNMNRNNPVAHIYGLMRVMNICGENPGYPDTPCTLGSVRLPNVIRKLGDWGWLRRAVRVGIRVLDAVIEQNPYPTRAIAEQAYLLRRIGLGPSGLDTLLRREGIGFATARANEVSDQIAREMRSAADEMSCELGCELGTYGDESPQRNVAVLAVAPNGHIARLEPEVSPSIYPDLYQPGAYAESLELTIEQHIDHVWSWQKHVDGGISYTVTLPAGSTWQDVDRLYRMSWERGLKAMSVYVDGSLQGQPCNVDGSCST